MCPCILVSTIILTLWQFWRWTFAKKNCLGLIISLRTERIMQWCSYINGPLGSDFSAVFISFHHISFRWANRMVWMLNLQCFRISWNSIRHCWMWKLLCIISIHPSGVVFAGTWFERACRPLWAVAPQAGGREQDETVYELDEVSHVFGDWHGLALHCPPLNVYMSLVHIYSKHWLKRRSKFQMSLCPWKKLYVLTENEWPYKTYQNMVEEHAVMILAWIIHTKHMEMAP